MQVLGIQVDHPFIRAAVVKRGRKGAEILALKSAPLNDPDDVKQLYIPSFKGRVASGLTAKELLIRSVEVSLRDSKHLEEVVAFQSEATSHFEPSSVLSVPYFLKKTENKTETLLFTTTRSSIRSHLDVLSKLAIDPDLVSAVPLGLIRYVLWKIPALTDAFLIDLGSSEWTCVWMEKGQLKKSHSIPGGVESLLSALWEDRKKILFQKEVEGFAKQFDLMQLKPNLNPHLSDRLSQMKQEMSKIIYSFHRICGSRPILFTGRGDAFGHLREFLVDGFRDSICGECNRAIPAEEQKYAVAIGLAIDPDASAIQLRRDEFFPKKNWKRAGLYALSLIAASLLVAGAIINAGINIAEARKKEMIESLQFSLDKWDSAFKESIFSKGKNEEEILDSWSHAVSVHAKEYPYILQAPRSSEFLSWLTNHPLLAAMKRENEPIEILSVRYQLLQYPKIDAPKETYRAKAEIEFFTKSPMSARKFHELLLHGEADPDHEVNWEPLNNDIYRVSFILKNRSKHEPIRKL